MTRIRWTAGASRQFETLINHIRQDNPRKGRIIAQTILGRIAQLAKFPALGKPGEQEGTRELVSPPYIIVYRLHAEIAEILFIWHGAQDWR